MQNPKAEVGRGVFLLADRARRPADDRFAGKRNTDIGPRRFLPALKGQMKTFDGK